MSWLGKGFREEAQAMADAYASMYNKEETIDEAVPLAGLIGSAAGKLAAGGTAKATAGMAAKGGVKKLASKVATNVAGSATEKAVTDKLSPKNEAPEFQSASVSEGTEQLDEISKGLATKAYAERRTNEFEGDELHTKSDKTRERIVKKHGEKAGKDADKAANKKIFGEEFEIVDEYCVSVEDGIALEEGKKKCKEGYKWDSEKGKCVKKKKKSSSSNKTTIIVTGRGGYYGGSHGHGGSNDDNDGDKETDSNGGDGGGDGGGGE